METGSFRTSLLCTRDVSRVAAFYARLAGWQFQPIAGTSLHRVVMEDGRLAAHAQVCAEGGGWIPHVAVEDVAATRETALSLGARLVSEDVHDGVARVVRLRDLEGAQFGLWQALDDQAIDSGGGIGALWWIEVLTLDVDAASGFYGALFGWTSRSTAFAPFDRYVVFERDGHQAGGALPMDASWEVDPRWSTIVAVADADQACVAATAEGGCVHFVHTVPSAGRIAVLGDPEGAVIVVRGPVYERGG